MDKEKWYPLAWHNKCLAIEVDRNSKLIMMNSEIEAYPSMMLGCIETRNRIICDNCKFNQNDYWDDDGIHFSIY